MDRGEPGDPRLTARRRRATLPPPMRPVSHTVIHPVAAPIERVFAVLTDPARIAQWLPGCGGVESPLPLRKGVRFQARFGDPEAEVEGVRFAPPPPLRLVQGGE